MAKNRGLEKTKKSEGILDDIIGAISGGSVRDNVHVRLTVLRKQKKEWQN